MQNNSKLIIHNLKLTLLGWRADEDFDSGIVKTVDWYLKKYNISKDYSL